ncbi:hypothetical protein [Nocardia asiatica]|uniref:hypothetical protein n=1 Tax=Nocardia asiatica TaxID=209252 RepID=UPI0024563F0F|nr:hypothetical protein [Nocardia asiatica]
MKPISTTMTFLVPLFFVLGVVAAPPAVAGTPAVKSGPGACTGSVCLPSLSQLLRRAPVPLRQSGRDAGEDDRENTHPASDDDLCSPPMPLCGS